MMERTADLLGPSPYTGEEPQAAAEAERLRRDYSVAPGKDPDEFGWAATATHVMVAPGDGKTLLDRLDADPNRPHAYGKMSLLYNWDVLWEIEYSNMNVGAVEKKLKRYSKDQGWNVNEIIDNTGTPLKIASAPGIGEINPGLKDMRHKEWSGMEMYDSPVTPQSDAPFYGLQDPEEDFPMSQPRTCSDCGMLMLNYDEWRKHTVEEHTNRDRRPPADPQPVVDYDNILPPGFNENVMDKTVQRQSRLIHQLAANTGKPLLPGPIPFIYDIEGDRIYVGHPGERHSDIQGRFTPGGIVEGLYDPKGHVQIKTDTDMPYTVRHLIQLWYALHPELEVKSIFLMVGDQKYKLASANIGHKVRNLAAADSAAWAVYQALAPLGNVYVVGGAIRDVVLNRTPNDIDLMVQGVDSQDVQEALESLPGKVDFTGQQFGVFRYSDREGNEVEVALPRTERSTGPGHKDFEVYTSPYITVEEDLARRDFTGNAMAVNLATGELVDPFQGSEHLKGSQLKAVSDKSFIEDPLRILRALTAVSKHQLEPTPELMKQMTEHAESLTELPEERIQVEMDKLMSGQDPARAIEMAEMTGVLSYVLPEIAATHGFDQQNKYHNLVLNEHLKAVLRLMASQTDDVDMRWAALLHDIGKPGSQWIDEDGWAHYYQSEDGRGQQHEILGHDMARELLTRMKFPNDRIDRIATLIRWHMSPPFSSQQGARKFLKRVGEDFAEDLLTLRWCDSGGKDVGNPTDGSVVEMRQLVKEVKDARQPTKKGDLAINGNDLIQMGMTPGPEMGRIIDWLTDMVVDDPNLNNRDTLLQMVQESAQTPMDAGVEADPNMTTAEDEIGNNNKFGYAKYANILDPVQDTLSETIFNRAETKRPEVKPQIITWAKRKIYQTLVNNGWPNPAEVDYLDLVLTGSLTTYQWSEHSDFDVSLWVKTESLPEWVRADLVNMMVGNCDGTIVPGTTHPLQVFVVDSREFTKDDLYQPGLRSAYDLDTKRWLVPPERHRAQDVHKNYPETIAYAKSVEDKIRLMLRYDSPALGVYWKFIKWQRRKDMMDGKGDFADSNIVYKWIANAGLFPHISEATGYYIA